MPRAGPVVDDRALQGRLQSAMQVGAKSGMVTMDAALNELIAKGLVSADDVHGKAADHAEQPRTSQGGMR